MPNQKDRSTLTIYASLDELRGRIREDVLVTCLDFDRDGEVDEEKFLSVIARPACADIVRLLGAGTFDPKDDAFREFVLDMYVYRMGVTFPAHVMVNVPAMWEKIQGDLDSIAA